MHGVRKHEVVISGLSGLYPECDDIEELWGRLMRKEEMVTVDGRRWLPGDFDVPAGTGKIKHPEYFDMTFFGIHRRLCEKMDPFTRLLCEQGYRAICDAGVNPRELDGTNTAVIMTTYMSEPMLDFGNLLLNQGSYNVLAFSRTMQANRLSYFLNTNGPSLQMDNTNCGGFEAIQHACDLISTGMCTAAIVGSCSLLYKAEVSFQYQMMGRLSDDCVTRSFSSDASGYARSEGCVTIFLQRKEHAKRIYGTVLGTNVFCHGTKDVEYAGFPRGRYDEFLVETYKKANVDPNDLAYVEAHGAASRPLDALELNGLSRALLKHRSKPLLIGSIKSNLGHTEGCSSMVSLTKALMAMDRGIIPPNISYSGPNPDVPDLVSGKLKVVTEPTPLDGGTVAVCELSVTGNCAHIILKANEKVKPSGDKEGDTKLPYLLTMSGRNEHALGKNMKELEGRGIDAEFSVLVNSLYKDGIKNHVYRGYSVISDEPNLYNMIEPAAGGERRPIWFMYSGMGSQWPTMAKSLMALPIFAEAINKCHTILEPKGINLLDIVCKDDPTIFDTILHSFVGIAAVQIGLTDVLRAVGVVPDGIIGHSVGELGCAYADGCMTAEQMVLAAHARGRASIEATLIKGMMAAVGAGYSHMKNIIPETIEVACRNSKDSCTLSGPAEDMAVFIAELKAKGMFAKLVNVANIAYHSRYIKPAAPALLKYLREIIPVPVKRSSKWVSSSNLEFNWNTDLAQYSSAEYHTNNLLSSVFFEEASTHIPSNAILIEIAPHGLMQAIVKRCLSHAIHIPLTSRFDKNNLMFLLGAIGKMFLAGIPIDLQALYPTAEFPVSRGTPVISPLIDWSREENFHIGRKIDDPDAQSPHCQYVSVDRNHDDFSAFLKHKINGKIVIPSSFYFKEMIDHFISIRNKDGNPIVMEKVKFLGYSDVNPNTSTELRFKLLQGRGNVVVSNTITADILFEGNIKTIDAASVKDLTAPASRNMNLHRISHDVMKEFMKCLGVEWDSSLISLGNVSIHNNCIMGTVRWEGNIGKFIMSLLALIEYVESKTSNTLKLFHAAGEIMINLPFLAVSNKPQDFAVQYDLINKKLQCEAVKIAHVECRNTKLSQHADSDRFFSFEIPQFTPYVNNNTLSYRECVNTCTQLILENSPLVNDSVIKITEIGLNSELHDALKEIHESVKYENRTSLTSFPSEEAFNKQSSTLLFQKDLWIVCAEPPSSATIRAIVSINNGFVLTTKDRTLDKFKIIFETQICGTMYTLYAITKPIKRQYEVVNLNSNYMANLRNQLLKAGDLTDGAINTVILWGQVDSLITVDSLIGETMDLPNRQHLHYWLFHGNAPEYNFYETGFKSQIERDVRMNILKDGQWGSLTLNASRATLDCARPSKFYFPLSTVAANQNILALGLNVNDNPSVDVNIPELGFYDYVCSNKKMGVGVYDPNSKIFTPDAILGWQKPSHWTSKEAASVPLLYSLASFILNHTNNAELTYENSILVNQALLPLSQAVICLAIHENMEVHATVYGQEEKEKLLSLFPKLNPKQIYDCSSVTFFVELLKNTDGGVYKVINNFDDPIMIEPCSICALELGVLIYASQALINTGAAMGMLKFGDQTVARGVSADILMNSSDDTKLEITNNITKALQVGSVVPIQPVVSLPPSTFNTEAVMYLASNPNKVVVDTDDIENRGFIQDDSRTKVIVEGKIQANLSMHIIEWLLKRGSRKVLLFSRQSHLSDVNYLRLQSLREQYKCAEIEVRPSNQLSTKLQIEKCIEEGSAPGPAMVFFLGSGLKQRIELFDVVSSSKLPDCNVICIGKEGEIVCERRKEKFLPAVYIRCSTANLEGVNLIHYLDSIVKDSHKTPVVIVKKYAAHSRSLHGLMANLTYLPETKDDLILFMAQSEVSNKATFVPIPTAGPPLKYCREVYPMFLIPGLQPNRLLKMASQLFCPTMEARIPANASSIDQTAEELASQLLALPHNMFTLCAEGWGGMLALHVAAKLEAKSKYVNLILLDASPASIIKWADSLLTNKVALFRKYLQIPPGTESNMKNSNWDDELKFAISNSDLTDEYQKTLATNSLSLLRRRLQSVLDAKPPHMKLNIKCHVFGLQSHAHEDHGLRDYLLKEPELHMKHSKTVDDMIGTDVATDVNSLLLYEHKDAANPPIEDYLGCDIIKKYEPHWQASLLYRVRE